MSDVFDLQIRSGVDLHDIISAIVEQLNKRELLTWIDTLVEELDDPMFTKELMDSVMKALAGMDEEYSEGVAAPNREAQTSVSLSNNCETLADRIAAVYEPEFVYDLVITLIGVMGDVVIDKQPFIRMIQDEVNAVASQKD